MLDPYYLLGVELTATPDDIRAAYRRRAAEVHPDRQPPEMRAWASERMKQLNAARDLLLDPAKRAEYDQKARLEMQKAVWRARRDSYTPPREYTPPWGRRPRRRGWPFTLLVMLFTFLLCVSISLALLTPASTPEGLMIALWLAGLTAYLKFVLALGSAIAGPLAITIFLVALFNYWKNY